MYDTGESEHQIDAIHGIAQSYFQRAKVCEREAKVEEAETNLMSCLEWQRKIEPNHERAKVLRELARLKFHQQDWDQGKQDFTEAAEIYRSLDHKLEEARCLDLAGRACYNLGKRRQAMDCWASAANTGAQRRIMTKKLEITTESWAFFSLMTGMSKTQKGYPDSSRYGSQRGGPRSLPVFLGTGCLERTQTRRATGCSGRRSSPPRMHCLG